MPFFDGAAGRVYYKHWAAPSPSATVVFLHGFGEHSGLYHRYAGALNSRGIDVWALDEIGHGLSDGADRGDFASLEALTVNGRHLLDLATASRPGMPAIVAGHSLGSIVATYLALEDAHRLAGLVISGAPLSPLTWLAEAADDPDGELALDPTDLSADPFYLDELENDPLAFTSADVVGLLGTAFPPAWQRLERELPRLALPALAVHGSRDVVAPIDGVRRWLGAVPALRLVEIADAGHDVLNEVAHRDVAATVADFVLSLVPAAEVA